MLWKLRNFLDGFNEIVYVYRKYFVFLTLIIFSLLLFQLNTNPPLTFIRQRAVYLSSVIGEQFTWVPHLFDYRETIRLLENQNMDLAKQNILLEDAYLENVRLRHLLHFKERFPLPTIPAQIIMRHPDPTLSTITLNKGYRDGVRVHQNVVTDRGLIGQIIDAENDYAVCQVMLDKNFRAAAKIQRTRINGIVFWQGRPNEVGFYGVLKNLDVRVGDVILTSEYSDYFLPNFRVGVVASVNNEIEGIFKDIHVRTALDFNSMEEVFIVTETSKHATSQKGFENYFLGGE
jgi:rod shape-determining protein MreC